MSEIVEVWARVVLRREQGEPVEATDIAEIVAGKLEGEELWLDDTLYVVESVTVEGKG